MSLRLRLLLALAYVLVLAVVALDLPLIIALDRRVQSEVRSQAESQADVVAATAAEFVAPARPVPLDRLVVTAAQSVRGRTVITNARGALIADSAGRAELGTSYASRPEIAAALRGRRFQATRTSRTLGQRILATAVPIVRGGRTVGAVRVTQSVEAVARAVARTRLGLILVGALVLVLGLAAGAAIARQFARPLRRLEATARRIAGGDLGARAELTGSTEQRSLAHSFNDMTGRLSRLVSSQRAFVADASHGLRTPLTALRLRLDEAEAAPTRAAAAVELSAARHEVDRLAALVDELLVLSRAGEEDAPAEPVDLGAAARRACRRWRGLAEERGAALRPVVDDPDARASCAPADLDRALDAVVENALAYGRGGQVTVRVRNGGIDVEDEGPGLEPGEEIEVFERFHRGSAGRTGPEGTGLGLPIARELMRRWGGEATLANRNGDSGAGAVARLVLPPSRSRGQARGRRAGFELVPHSGERARAPDQ